MSRPRVQRVVTSGTFNLDGGSWQVENNVWLIGDDEQVLVIDAAHDASAIIAAVGRRSVVAIACTHAHDDHVNVAPELAERFDAPIWLHPADAVLWKQTHPAREPDGDLADGQRIVVGGLGIDVVHTPGHAPGAVCFHAAALDSVFTGDTLFRGGPGATGRSFSDFDAIVTSITTRLFAMPAETTVYTGHGSHTRIGEERRRLDEWIRRGH
jgi:glyoxylase-like metal-dependent hydrolase (beta-lactamase superfamily II)